MSFHESELVGGKNTVNLACNSCNFAFMISNDLYL